MSEAFDVVVAGAGHNSLIAAAYLSTAGMRCLVVDARAVAGGDTATEELTLPGFLHDSCSTSHNLIQSSPTLRRDELGLSALGLEYLYPDPVVHVPFPDGSSITQWRELDRTCAELARFSRRDADAYRDLVDRYSAVAPVVGAWRYTPIGWGPALADALLAAPDGAKWVRRAAASAWDEIAATFEEEHVRAFMAWMAFTTVQPLEQPGTGLNAYSLVYGRQQHSWVVPRGGSGALPAALVRVVEAAGGEVRTGETVVALRLEHGRCVGVETGHGARYDATRAVLSTIHVKHLVEMAPSELWDESFRYSVDSWKPGIGMFVTHYALSAPLEYPGEGGALRPLASGIPVSTSRLRDVEVDVRRGRVALDDPPLLVLCPTAVDASRAPEARHVLKVVGFHPYDVEGGAARWDDIAEEVSDAHLRHLRRYSPDLTDETILARSVHSPLDLERANAHNWHGSCHGGDSGPAQSGALRPAAGWATHRMPIPGLYQTGSTTHPGGSVSGAPGRNAARVILRDLGIDLDEVVARSTSARAHGLPGS
ncbi:MAG: NAD(P)/FAD-dependent oxidoreductase [Actinomycetota bacterium]|nr:NAD(P)/FAD-dependent oxidoreductase [Actinomycetota bacterium]